MKGTWYPLSKVVCSNLVDRKGHIEKVTLNLNPAMLKSDPLISDARYLNEKITTIISINKQTEFMVIHTGSQIQAINIARAKADIMKQGKKYGNL